MADGQMRSGNTALLTAALALLQLSLSLAAQTVVPNPALHRRVGDQMDGGVDIETRSSGTTLLPLDASGEYALGAGGMIDVELQHDRLSGYVSRLGDRESDQGTPLTFFFATSRLAGDRLAFTTRQIHGLWFSFEGTIVRGPARTREQEGYYLLEGGLVMHDVASRMQQQRNVSLSLARQAMAGR
jgi:hypothetical protein